MPSKHCWRPAVRRPAGIHMPPASQQQKTRAGTDVSYGLGLRLADQPGEVFHGGTAVGGSAYLYIRVGAGTVVAFATNVDRWTEPRHQLARSLADWAESQ